MKASDFFEGVKQIDVHGPKIIWHFNIFGVRINITETILIGWGIIVAVTALVLFLTHNMQKKPVKRRQVIAEYLVNMANNLVKSTMGERFISFAPYVGALFTFSLLGSLVSLLGLRSVTADYNTTLCWALMTFVMIEGSKFRTNGFFGYFKSFAQPTPVMTPLNIISEVATPVSMSFRHFGNIAGGMIISSLIYFALTGLSTAVGLTVPIFTIGIPAVLSLYFDLFTGFMQAFIFCMLTMVYISNACEKD